MTAAEVEEPSAFEIRLDQQDLYRFAVDFEMAGVDPWIIDEPPPLGEGAGPNASRLLAAAVGHCLSSSALFCLKKAHVPVQGVHTTVSGSTARNEHGRLRVGALRVAIALDVAEADRARLGRCLQLFEDFCVVTASVRGGIPVEVTVTAGEELVAGTRHESG